MSTAVAINGSGTRNSFVWWRLLVAGWAWGVMVIALLIVGTVAPGFEEMFREFGVRVGPAQKIVIGLGRAVMSPAGIAFVLLVMPAVCFAMAMLALPPGREARVRWAALVMLIAAPVAVAVGLVTIMQVAMYVPMAEIQEKLRAAPPAGPGTPAR